MNARETDGLRFVKLKLPAKKSFNLLWNRENEHPRNWHPF